MTRLLFAVAVTLFAACGGPRERAESRSPVPPPEPVSLIARDSLDGWQVLDNWIGGGAPVEVVDGELSIGAGFPMNGLKIDDAVIDLPAVPYEIDLEAKRVEGRDIFLGLTFPVPGREACVTFIAGGWGGGITGISSINFRDASQNSTMSDQRYENETWYRFRIEVCPGVIKVWMDGRIIVNAFIEGRNIGMRPGEVEQVQPFGLITWETRAAIRNLTIRELAATGGGE